MMQHSDLSDDARSSVLQTYAKDLHEALHPQPENERGGHSEGSEHAPQDQVSPHCRLESETKGSIT